MSTARGIRNKNPGNIRWLQTVTWQGQTGWDDAGFVVFDTAENGIRALAKQLLIYQDKYGLNTAAGIVNRWAPPSENDTGAYVQAVEAMVRTGTLDLHQASTLYLLTAAIIKHENGTVPYTGEQIAAGVSAALGAPDTQPAAPIEDRSTTLPKPKGTSMDPLSLLTFLGPIVAKLLPVVGGFLTSEKAKTNLDKVGTIFSTITQATGAPNLQAAVEAMQDPITGKAAVADARSAIVNSPEISQFLEVGGGFAAARENDLKMQAASQGPDARPFYQTSAVFWVSVLLLPLVYWLVGSLIVGGTPIPSDAPWYIQIFRVFGGVWNGESRSGGFNLVIGLVLGGICGVYYGISVTQAKQSPAAASSDPSRG